MKKFANIVFVLTIVVLRYANICTKSRAKNFPLFSSILYYCLLNISNLNLKPQVVASVRKFLRLSALP